MNKLIIIYRHHFTQKEYEKLDLKFFLKKKVIIEIWVVNKLLKDKTILPNMKNKNNLKIYLIKNFNDLENRIISQQNNNIIYQLHLKFESKSINIFKLISKYDCKYSISPGLTIKNKKNTKQKLTKLINKILNLDVLYLIKILINKVDNFINQIFFLIQINSFNFKKANFFYCRAKKYYEDNKDHFLISKDTKIIWGHQKDYEFYLENKKKGSKKNKKKILFLDQNVPYHSDLIVLGVADVKAKEYYNSINNFLEKLSQKLKIKAHVCCHPRANLKKLKRFFPNISLSRGNTAKQILNAKCLVAHDSTALNFGVLYLKPIIYIINSPLIKSKWPHIDEINNSALRLKKKVYNIDDNQELLFKNLKNELKVNSHNYWIYIKNYIKFKGTNNSSAEETVKKLKLYKIWK